MALLIRKLFAVLVETRSPAIADLSLYSA